MARPKKPIKLRVPDLGNLSPEERDWLDERICDALEFIFKFPLETENDEIRETTQDGICEVSEVAQSPDRVASEG